VDDGVDASVTDNGVDASAARSTMEWMRARRGSG
jgi:hypothetical protein